jgi:hypothetical protein
MACLDAKAEERDSTYQKHVTQDKTLLFDCFIVELDTGPRQVFEQ